MKLVISETRQEEEVGGAGLGAWDRNNCRRWQKSPLKTEGAKGREMEARGGREGALRAPLPSLVSTLPATVPRRTIRGCLVAVA